jgi:hypothetical protein
MAAADKPHVVRESRIETDSAPSRTASSFSNGSIAIGRASNGPYRVAAVVLWRFCHHRAQASGGWPFIGRQAARLAQANQHIDAERHPDLPADRAEIGPGIGRPRVRRPRDRIGCRSDHPPELVERRPVALTPEMQQGQRQPQPRIWLHRVGTAIVDRLVEHAQRGVDQPRTRGRFCRIGHWSRTAPDAAPRHVRGTQMSRIPSPNSPAPRYVQSRW